MKINLSKKDLKFMNSKNNEYKFVLNSNKLYLEYIDYGDKFIGISEIENLFDIRIEFELARLDLENNFRREWIKKSKSRKEKAESKLEKNNISHNIFYFEEKIIQNKNKINNLLFLKDYFLNNETISEELITMILLKINNKSLSIWEISQLIEGER